MAARRLNQTFHWAHFLGTAPPPPPPPHARAGFFDFISWMGLTWGNNTQPAGDTFDFDWTDLAPSADSRLIYVSESDGDDSNNGLSAATPKATAAAGYALLRNGYPDWLMFKCGDEWATRIKDLWPLSGRSPTERMVITSYGTGARPKFRFGGSPIIQSNTDSSGSYPRYLAFTGLEFHCNGTPTGAGFHWYERSDYVLIEDMYIHGYIQGIAIGGGHGYRHTNISARGNVIADNFLSGTFSTGLLVGQVDTLLVEQNYFLNNGYQDPAEYLEFHHNVYINNYCTDVTYIDNISTGADGHMVRPGGTVTRNIASRVNFGLSVGSGYDVEPAGISPTVEDNWVIEGRDDTDGVTITHAGGTAYQIGNWVGGTFSRNRMVNCTGTDPRPIWCKEFPSGGVNTGIGLRNVTIEGNISHNWGGAFFQFQAGSSSNFYEGNTVTDNVHQNPDNTTLYGSGRVISIDHPVDHTKFEFVTNHFLQASGATAGNFASINGSSQTFAAWETYFIAPSNDQSAQSYSAPEDATFGGYFIDSYGGTGNPDDDVNHDGLVALMQAQSKQDWDTGLTAQAITDYLESCL